MNINPKVFLLLRTHNRPIEFNNCINSISKQSVLPEIIIISDDKNDTYINNVKIPHLVFHPKHITRKWWIRNHNPYNDYFNQALSIIPDNNYVIYLDDDDLLLNKDWVKIILEKKVNVLIGKFKMGENHNFNLIGTKIKRGEIGTSCFAIRSEISKIYKWQKKRGGDFLFIKQITEDYNPEFIDIIIGGVQTNLNKSWKN